MICEKLEKNIWKELSESAHLIVFNELKSSALDRVDFALLISNETQKPMAFVTCQELDAFTLYWQYGGSFPDTKDTIYSVRSFELFLKWCRDHGYQRVGFRVENNNFPMLKLAMKSGFKIVGLRAFGGYVLLEHLKEF